jgi:hypothetical protein
MGWLPWSFISLALCACGALGHGAGGHEQIVVADDADWATRHMAGMVPYESPTTCIDS